jgi:hypothetical protein
VTVFNGGDDPFPLSEYDEDEAFGSWYGFAEHIDDTVLDQMKAEDECKRDGHDIPDGRGVCMCCGKFVT